MCRTPPISRRLCCTSECCVAVLVVVVVVGFKLVCGVWWAECVQWLATGIWTYSTAKRISRSAQRNTFHAMRYLVGPSFIQRLKIFGCFFFSIFVYFLLFFFSSFCCWLRKTHFFRFIYCMSVSCAGGRGVPPALLSLLPVLHRRVGGSRELPIRVHRSGGWCRCRCRCRWWRQCAAAHASSATKSCGDWRCARLWWRQVCV